MAWWIFPVVAVLGMTPALLAAGFVGYWLLRPSAPAQQEVAITEPRLVEERPVVPRVALVAELLHAPQRDESLPATPVAVVTPVAPEPVRTTPTAELITTPPRPAFLRRNTTTERDLLATLARGEGVTLGPGRTKIYPAYIRQFESGEKRAGGKGASDAGPLLKLRPDLALLPLRDGPSRQLPVKAANELGVLSRKMHTYLKTIAPAGNDGRRNSVVVLGEQLREDMRGKKPEWIRSEAVPTLSQMLVAEDEPGRRLLVEVMAAIPDRPATVALARRAAFDMSFTIRAQAIEALKGRPAEHWRPIFLDALRYPWAPPADFAAEALVELQDVDAIPDLVHLLSKPHAGRPFATSDNRRVLREVVRIEHRANCLMCHPPALTGTEPVIGIDPVTTIPPQPGKPGKVYGGKLVRAPQPGTSTHLPIWVRADITFMRPDFSVSLPLTDEVALGRPGPIARFDFVIRTRPVPNDEKRRWDAMEDKADHQREAVLFALRELSGRDEGDTADAWSLAYPHAEAEVRSRKLADELVRAEVLARGALMLQYRDAEGIEYMWALAKAIPRLGAGPAPELARTALHTRMQKLSADELRARLKDRNLEVRRAAVQTCAAKGREFEADLQALLDGDATTAALARAALKKLGGE